MGKLTKILAPMVAILAIAACVISVLCFLEYKKYKARATKLAATITEITARLDQKSESGAPEKVTFTAGTPGVKESGTLSYLENRKDTAALDTALESSKELTNKIMEQRDAMATALETISISLKNNAIKADELCKLEGYPEKIALANSYAKAVYDMQQDLAAQVEALGRPLGVKISIFRTPKVSGTTATKQNNKPNTDRIANAINAVNRQKATYENTIKKLETTIKAHAFVSHPKNLNAQNHAKLLPQLDKDLVAINNKLTELARVKNQLAALQKTVNQQKQQIANLTNKNKNLEKQLAEARKELEKTLASISKAEDPKQPAKPARTVLTGDVNPNTQGKVILFSKEWNYIISDIGNDRIKTGTTVVVAYNNTFLGSGIVSKAEDTLSLIEMTSLKAQDIPVGAEVFMSPKE